MKRVLYVSPFIPAEWIAAHGMTPSRIVPAADSHAGLPEGVCAWARNFAAAVEREPDAAAIFTTTCDQMRRMAEVVRRRGRAATFLFNVPASWKSAQAQEMYLSELGRLGKFLVELGGTAPGNDLLTTTMLQYEDRRREMAAVRALSRENTPGIPIALVGGPLSKEHLGLFDLVESAGGFVALDATETGERCMPGVIDRRKAALHPMECLLDAYFRTIPDAFRRPDNALFDWLGVKIRERGIRGILLRHYTWCDIWHAQARRLKEWAEVPVVAVSCADGSDTAAPANADRRVDRDDAMMTAPEKISLDRWAARYPLLKKDGLREPWYGGPLERHIQDGDLRLRKLQFDNSAAALRLWNFLLTEEDRLAQIARRRQEARRRDEGPGHGPGDGVLAAERDGLLSGRRVVDTVRDGDGRRGCLRIADSLGIDESFCPVRAMLGAFVNGEHFPDPRPAGVQRGRDLRRLLGHRPAAGGAGISRSCGGRFRIAARRSRAKKGSAAGRVRGARGAGRVRPERSWSGFAA